jgi:transcriptional regulator with XRE-family HTH domain
MKRNFRDFLKDHFSPDEILQIDVEAENEAKAILRAQELATVFITSLMEEQKIGFNEFARKTKVSPSHLSAILKGKSSPSLTTLARIAATFGKSINVSQG